MPRRPHIHRFQTGRKTVSNPNAAFEDSVISSKGQGITGPYRYISIDYCSMSEIRQALMALPTI